MKISSIKEIKNIGTFADFPNGSSFRFEKLTFIYGYNTFGKTTLTDIFQSLKNNAPELLSSRLTIPQIPPPQKVSLSIKEGQSEKTLVFQNNCWGQNNISNYIEIFGTDFIHKNLFTGYSIERENKKNFTQFILGNDGVQLAKNIADKKKRLRESKAEVKKNIPVFVKNKSEEEIDNFIDFSIQGLDKEEIDIELSKKKIKKKDEEIRLKEPQNILQLHYIDSYDVPEINVLDYFSNINAFFQKDYSSIKEEALTKINSHIETNFSEVNGSENWIKQGLVKCSDKENGNCVFCGQDLSNAKDLIDAYDSYFDDEYKKFILEVEDGFKLNIESIENEDLDQKIILQETLNKSYKFKDLINHSTFQSALVQLEEKINLLNEEILVNDKKLLLKEVSILIEEKNKKPFEKTNEVNFEEFSGNVNTYKTLLSEIKGITEILKVYVEEFKEQYKDTSIIEGNINRLQDEIDILDYKKYRIEYDQGCKDFTISKDNVTILIGEITTLETELESNQSIYLGGYFDKINTLFKKFGSKNFTLTREDSGRGDMPVYSLKVEFHNQIISNDELITIFSESDRRALALAIFWAKIDLKDDDEKSKTIVVLDDPITSFDDNRVSNSIDLFKTSLNNLSQIIILTHYPSFIKNFCEKTKEEDAKFFRLQKNNTTSFLENQNRKEFTESQYEKTFSKIDGYINREHNNCIKTDLRPFLENLYLPTLFAKELNRAISNSEDISTLSLKINVIFSDREEVKNRFHDFRNNLNPDSHIFTSNNDEDVRNFADDMFEYLYSFNF
ncbi:MAG: AAA family ATPase [Cellulophaga sp.]